jgi:hypothetical protein
MSAHGLIMSSFSVVGLIEGRKTRTSRVIKPQPEWIESSGRWVWPLPKRVWKPGCCREVCTASREWFEYAPKGSFRFEVGDTFFVKETYGLGEENNVESGVYYRATDPAWDAEETGFRWKSPLFMKREHSRISGRIVSVDRHRIQEITDAQALAEGIRNEGGRYGSTGPYVTTYRSTPRLAFADLWDSLHAMPKPVRCRGVISHYESHPWEGLSITREYRGLPWYVFPNPFVYGLGLEVFK